MTIREMTLSDIDQLVATAETIDVAFQMDEDAFRSFYDRTARPIWAYLSRTTGDNRLADDLLQETYYRFLRARVTYTDEAHRRHYLFRIAINLVRDYHRRPRFDSLFALDERQQSALHSGSDAADRAASRIDLSRAMARLKRRDRDLLWLAYANGSTHEEIASTLGLKAASIKSLLFRARRRLVSLLGPEGRHD